MVFQIKLGAVQIIQLFGSKNESVRMSEITYCHL